jgi:hypothetical protein
VSSRTAETGKLLDGLEENPTGRRQGRRDRRAGISGEGVGEGGFEGGGVGSSGPDAETSEKVMGWHKTEETEGKDERVKEIEEDQNGR